MNFTISLKAVAADLVVLLLIIGYAFLMRKKGLVELVFGAAKGILAIFITIKLYPLAAKLLVGNGFDAKLEGWLTRTCEWRPLEKIESGGIAGMLINGREWRPLAGLSGQGGAIVNVVSFILTFVIIYILLAILGLVLRNVKKIPVIGELNATLGFIIGLAVALLFLFIVLAAIRLLDLKNAVDFINEVLNKGLFLKLMYKYNVVWLFFRGGL